MRETWLAFVKANALKSASGEIKEDAASASRHYYLCRSAGEKGDFVPRKEEKDDGSIFLSFFFFSSQIS